MEERSSIEILLDYPKNKGLPYETHTSDKRFYLSPNDPILNTKYVLFKRDSLIFFAYDSFAAKASMNQTFSGVYALSYFEDDFECEITKKYWIDKLRTQKKKTGIKTIDDNLTIRSHSDKGIEKYVSKNIASLFLELSKIISPMKLIVKNDYLRLIGEFKSENIIGLETNKWIYKREDVEALLNIGGEIIEEFKNSYTRKSN